MFGRSEGFTPFVVSLLNMQLLHAISWESYCVVYMLAWHWKWQYLHVDKVLRGNVEDGFVIGSTYISLPDTDATPDAMLFRQFQTTGGPMFLLVTQRMPLLSIMSA